MNNIAPYSINEIMPGIFAIDEGGVCSFLIPGKEEALLIDSGFGRGDLLAQVREITELPVYLVHTHTDGDHTGCDAQFDRIALHPAEFGHYTHNLAESGKNPVEMIARSEAVLEGRMLEYGEYRFEIILIPGHTPGSIALLDREKRVLIGGDSIQEGAVFMFGFGRDMTAYLDSMKKLENMRGMFDKVIASHGKTVIGSDILPDIIEGAQAYLDGKIEGTQPPFDMPCKLFTFKRAKFLC